MRSGFNAERASASHGGDKAMLAAVLLLAGVGIAALWSASSDYALSLGRSSGYFALRQAMFLLPSAAVFWACAAVDLDALRSRTGVLTLVALGLLLLPFVPGLGGTRNGANRWIDLRFTTFQPSELWKPALVLYLAHMLDKKRERMEESAGVLVPPFLLAALGCLLVYAQNDFSTAAISGLAGIAVFWAAGAPASAGPEMISLASLSQSFQPVHFPHGAHAQRNASCANCHHHPTDRSETPACRECHGEPFQDQARPGLKGAYHRQCIGCHQTGGSGPLHCDGCHLRK
jgi:cell division protein FtsW (lipid II flippase)